MHGGQRHPISCVITVLTNQMSVKCEVDSEWNTPVYRLNRTELLDSSMPYKQIHTLGKLVMIAIINSSIAFSIVEYAVCRIIRQMYLWGSDSELPSHLILLLFQYSPFGAHLTGPVVHNHSL